MSTTVTLSDYHVINGCFTTFSFDYDLENKKYFTHIIYWWQQIFKYFITITLEVVLRRYNPIIALPSSSEVVQWGIPPKVTVNDGVPYELPVDTLYENIRHFWLDLDGRRGGDNNFPKVEGP